MFEHRHFNFDIQLTWQVPVTDDNYPQAERHAAAPGSSKALILVKHASLRATAYIML